MLVFLDETFRKHKRTGNGFSVISGVAIPEDTFGGFQRDWYGLVKPYYGAVLKEGHDVHGHDLLTATTLRIVASGGHSGHWSLAEDILNYAYRRRIRAFGVVCFQDEYQSLVCADEDRLDKTYRRLFERIDVYMREKFPKRYAKLVFDDRGHSTNSRNGRAATNFLSKSTVGSGYDTIIRTPFFGVSQANNYGLQMADLVTTVLGLRFQGSDAVYPLWRKVHSMLYRFQVGERRFSSLHLMRNKNDSAAVKPMAGEIAQHRVATSIIVGENLPDVNIDSSRTQSRVVIVPNPPLNPQVSAPPASPDSLGITDLRGS